MALLAILEYPDPRLRTKAAPVTVFDAALKRQIADMFETMYAAPGIGLAATQVDWHHRLIVIDVSEDKNQPQVFINPEILSREGEATGEEGCLSVPGIFDDVRARRADPRARAGRGRQAPSSASSTACWPSACSTRWITSRASCSSTTCPSSSASASARSSTRNGANAAPAQRRGTSAGTCPEKPPAHSHQNVSASPSRPSIWKYVLPENWKTQVAPPLLTQKIRDDGSMNVR